MISHSPPIFSHSPPVSFLSEYMNNHRHQTINNYNDEPNRASRYCRPKVITLASKIMVNNASNIANSVNNNNCENNQQNYNNSINFNNNNNNNNNSNFNNNYINKLQKQQQNQRAFAFLSNINNNNNNNINNNNYNNNNSNNNNINNTFLSATEKRINGLERMTSVPNLPLLPKSCLMRKKCQHKCVPATKATSTLLTPTDNSKTSFNIDDDINHNNNNNENENTICELCRSRKKVIFADDEGLSLTEVRVMSEPSNVPPYWSIKFLEQITQGLVTPHPADQWTVDFKQPASDYLKFRQKIENSLVSLENVIVKDEESIVVGTVKVKNISFEKEVIVRVTWDDWRSQQDIFCTYARAYGPQTCAHVVFDTFSFKITLPPSSKRLEFCICYRTNNKEYWDNNNGQNYTITKRSPFYYNALSPYEKNSTRQNGTSAHIMSTLTEALANGNQQARINRQEETSPYW